MPLVASNEKLLTVIASWQPPSVKGAVIVVDEGLGDPDKSGDRAERHFMARGGDDLRGFVNAGML